jgi:hypothetical protein
MTLTVQSDPDTVADLGDGSKPRAGAIAIVLSAVSIASFVYFYSQGMTNVYHDGIAHLNIARKVVDHPDDSFWQRYIQIGSPWLPVQTVLMLPFVANDTMWRSGIAGSIISMVSYVVAGVSLYLLAAGIFRHDPDPYRRSLPVVAVAAFALNPSVLYMQSAPMTELPFMASLTLSVLMLRKWMERRTPGSLILAGALFSVAMLTRYEAWPVAVTAVGFVALAAGGGLFARLKAVLLFAITASLGPVYWMWHNWAIWGDPLTFLRGPYSARGLYLQYQSHFGWAKIFIGNLPLDVALLLFTVSVCAGPLLVLLAAAGFLKMVRVHYSRIAVLAPIVLLSVPFGFHLISLYRGEIQMMSISAIGLYNVRYGLPHLVVVSLLAAAAVTLLRRAGPRAALVAIGGLIGIQYALLLWEGPSQLAIYQEAYRNGVNSRVARNLLRAAGHLREHPPRPAILMHTGALGQLVSAGGMRFADVIHEGTTRWHQVRELIPADVSTVILQDGDPLDQLLRSNDALQRDFGANFRERFAVGKVRVFERNRPE